MMQLSDVTFEKILSTFALIMLAALLYSQIMSAVKAWREEKKRKNAPVEDLSGKVKANAAKLADHVRMLHNDKERIDFMDKQSNILLRSMMAMLSHEINGNSVDKLQASMSEINEYLVNRK